jgi:tetratricopeptide (TPR) repeat protein
MAFHPPTPKQVVEHLRRHPVQGRPSLAAWLPLVALAVIMALTFTAHDGLLWLLPWLLLAAVFAWLAWRVHWMRDIERRVSRVNELGLQRQWPESLRLAWRLLPSLATLPELHGRTVAMMAYNLEQVKAYEASIITYDYLIERLPQDHPGCVHLRIQRAIAQLAGDQLADADDALRRLRGMVDRFANTTIAAGYRLATLLQQVRTRHYDDAVQYSGDLVEALRPLGIDAGYGHALLALSYRQLAVQHDDTRQLREAQAWWSQATLLLPPSALAQRFEEIGELTQSLRPTPAPWHEPVPADDPAMPPKGLPHDR